MPVSFRTQRHSTPRADDPAALAFREDLSDRGDPQEPAAHKMIEPLDAPLRDGEEKLIVLSAVESIQKRVLPGKAAERPQRTGDRQKRGPELHPDAARIA